MPTDGSYLPRNSVAAARTGSYRLTPPGAPKDTQHHVVSLQGTPLRYRPGDALGVYPRNEPSLVDRVLSRLGASGSEPVTAARDEQIPFREALSARWDLAIPSRRLLEACAAQGAALFTTLLAPESSDRLKEYLRGGDSVHDVLAVLEDAPGASFTPAEFAGLVRALQPRLYSIASSERVHPREAHLMVLSVRFPSFGRTQLGVGSTFINERWPEGTTAPVYVQDAQKHFAMPADPATPLIMIGPGTGLAPFRAFLEERDATGAPGRNWLFFGEQSRSWGFYYERELTAWQERGLLRLDLAFSRDQPAKIYVQQRMREHARELYAWLEEGAEIFICGDKERMAADVQRELQAIVELQGQSAAAAAEYVAALKKSRRLKLDVY